MSGHLIARALSAVGWYGLPSTKLWRFSTGETYPIVGHELEVGTVLFSP